MGNVISFTCLCNLFTDILNEIDENDNLKICIDLANGHMKVLLNLVKSIKEKYGDKIKIMTGNIANPKTYKSYEEAGVDYCRCSVGTGAGCITSSLTAIHYPIFSLLK